MHDIINLIHLLISVIAIFVAIPSCVITLCALGVVIGDVNMHDYSTFEDDLILFIRWFLFSIISVAWLVICV